MGFWASSRGSQATPSMCGKFVPEYTLSRSPGAHLANCQGLSRPGNGADDRAIQELGVAWYLPRYPIHQIALDNPGIMPHRPTAHYGHKLLCLACVNRCLTTPVCIHPSELLMEDFTPGTQNGLEPNEPPDDNLPQCAEISVAELLSIGNLGGFEAALADGIGDLRTEFVRNTLPVPVIPQLIPQDKRYEVL